MVRILSIVLITIFLTGFTPDPEPEPTSKGFVSVFDNKRKRADRHFNNFEYKSAIQLYNKLIAKGKADDLVKLRLAESYLKLNDPVNAEKWYAEVIHSYHVTPQHQMQYAHTLLSNGKYQEARQVIESYEFAQSDYRSQAIINTLDMLETLYADSTYYQMNSIPDNKPGYSDFSPTTYKNGIVFVSSRHNKGPKFKWDETPFLDLYYTETDIASAVPFSKNLNSKYHEGPIAFYDNFSKAVFTRSNYLDKELGMTDQGINNLRLYTASWNDAESDWSNIEPVEFMIANYSYGHPTISADNQKLYFVSDMPGGFGGTDIYVSERTEMGWSDPVNLGEVINTSGNEMYPFIDNDENLYFSSNGHGGLGGLDMYQISLNGSTAVRNMGYPMNTTADDFGFSMTESGEIAYISSNREGVDNIFKVDIQAPDLEMILADNVINDGEAPDILDEIQTVATNQLSTEEALEGPAEELSTINAAVLDENNNIIPNANVQLLVNGEELQTLTSNENGEITVQVPADQEYTILATKDGFGERMITIPAESLGQQEDLLIVLNDIGDHPDELLPTTELDPLAVSDDGWDENALESQDRPEINGVALAALPEFDEADEELPTTELDPLAVSDDGWDEIALDNQDRPAIKGVALAALPQFDQGEEELSTQELDPLAVSDSPLEDSGLEDNSRPEVTGVALSELPEESSDFPQEFNEEVATRNTSTQDIDDQDRGTQDSNLGSDELPTTELDPLAVSDDGWDDNALDSQDRPAISGVALADVPNFGKADEELSTQELDPLAVSDSALEDSGLEDNTRPEITGVALNELPEESSDFPQEFNEDVAAQNISTQDIDDQNRGTQDSNLGSDELPTTELDPLAVSDDGWDDNALESQDRPAINDVALAEVPEFDDADDELSTQELDPLAVSDNVLEDSGLDGNNRPEISGVALSELPQESSDFPQEFNEDLEAQNSGSLFSNTASEPLALTESGPSESDDNWEEGLLADQQPATNDGFSLIESQTISDTDTEPALAIADLPNTDQLEMQDNRQSNTNPTNQLAQDAFKDVSDERIADESLASWSESNEEAQLVESGSNIEPGENQALLDENPEGKQLVSTKAIDAISGMRLADANLQLFIDSPNETLDYELRDGVLTFEALPEEQYLIVASHDDYQDQFITLSGEDLLSSTMEDIDLELSRLSDVSDRKQKDGKAAKFKAVVRDQQTGELLEDASVKFFVDGKAIESEYSGENGKTAFKSPDGSDYMMLVSRDGYQDLIYHLPGAPLENTDVDLAMLQAEDVEPYSPYQLLAMKGQAFDEFTGADLDNVKFTVFENGELIETTENLDGLEVDPDSHYQILAEKEGYQASMITVDPEEFLGKDSQNLAFALKEEQISESSGMPVYNVSPDEAGVLVSATIVDMSSDQPLSEATVIIFADDEIQEQLKTWNTGNVDINVVPGKNYHLLVKRDGYSDKIVALGEVSNADEVEIALVPADIKNLRQSGANLDNANMLVMSGPTGEDQMYLATDNDLYQYVVENDNHYLVNDQGKILLKERTRSLGSKVNSRQDTDQYMLRNEDEFLYDQLTGDEKAMVDKIVTQMVEGDLESNSDLNIYYNNLPEEYRELVNTMVAIRESSMNTESNVPSNKTESLDYLLAEKRMRVAKTFNVNNIYYDFDKDEIREDAAIELDKLAAILNSNQHIKISMFSHADSRGSSSYNDVLSKKRGISAINYLSEKGVSKDRLFMEAKGESQLVNSCVDSIKCSEQAHQLNRRTEFILST